MTSTQTSSNHPTWSDEVHERAARATQRTRTLEGRVVHRSFPSLHKIGAVLLAFLGGWLLFSTFMVAYPYTVLGQNSQLRETGFSIVVSLAALSLLTTRSRIGSVVAVLAGSVLAATGFLADHESLAVAANEVVTGILVVFAAALTFDRPASD